MLPDWVSNPEPLTYESGALLIALCGLATRSDCIDIQTDPFLYARLKNGRIMLYPSASVRPSVNFFVSV